MKTLKKIMVIEDDPDIRDILELSLDTLGGFELSLHDNAVSALASASNFCPDLILLDVMLPELSGPEALPKFREQPAGQAAAIVFLTAKASASARDELMLQGAQEVLFKPFDPVTLPEQLQAIWEAIQSHA